MTAVTNGLINLFHGRWSILAQVFHSTAGFPLGTLSHRAVWLLARNSATRRFRILRSAGTCGLAARVNSSSPSLLNAGSLPTTRHAGTSCFSTRREPRILLEKPSNHVDVSLYVFFEGHRFLSNSYRFFFRMIRLCLAIQRILNCPYSKRPITAANTRFYWSRYYRFASIHICMTAATSSRRTFLLLEKNSPWRG